MFLVFRYYSTTNLWTLLFLTLSPDSDRAEVRLLLIAHRYINVDLTVHHRLQTHLDVAAYAFGTSKGAPGDGSKKLERDQK
ncbi:uncharacterized protein EV420DRAFT_1650575 [Desarmillaria tabescens]|uniref:Uncharacterized protein n=1 Tax=Armillaria tabescens TaxID=1929756 RepID=A0AA39JCE4_ARMTA|nr:uncharacterized protein EV420DRAFT_1650575 [Desarmillaria tabescens]KAK0440185.1 hypothetical protein EV420DRAFT_1650575 [Desarmillaria tabescens]